MITMGTSALYELQSWVIYHWMPKDNIAFMSDGFKSRDIGLRAQKKILSRMANKNIAKMLIDDTTASILDQLYKLAKQYSENKKESEKLIKNIIKVVIKIGVLYRNGQFGEKEMQEGERLHKRLHAAAMAVMSFHEVEYSYDRIYLAKQLTECRSSVKALVAPHLTLKSIARIDSVFDFFSDPTFLDHIFTRPEYRDTMTRFVTDLHKAMDEGGM